MAKRKRAHAGRVVRTAIKHGRLTRPKALRTTSSASAVSPAPAPPVRFLTALAPPAAAAVQVLERGMEALQRHRYLEAAGHFRRLLSDFPSERALLDRARVYLELCDREIRRQGSSAQKPKTLEERLTAATAALNDEEDDAAERLAQSVLADAPKHELALYLLAAVEARRGDSDAAMGYLTRAAQHSPEILAQARHDADFTGLRDMDEFRRLIDGTPNGNGTRRPRR